MFARKHYGADVPRQTLGRILERLMQRGYTRDALRRGRSDRRGRESGEAGSRASRLRFSGRRIRAIRNRSITICRTGVTKQHSLGRL